MFSPPPRLGRAAVGPLLGTRSGLLAGALVGALVGAACGPTVPARPPGPASPAHVVGTLTLLVGQLPGAGAAIELPDAGVFLRDSAGAHAADAKTQLDGRFRLRVPRPGTYTVCWTADGFGAGCGPRVVVARGADQFLGTVPVRADRVVYGTALTADARACWAQDPYFGLNVSTRVTLLDSAGRPAAAPARANVYGEYAIGGAPTGRAAAVQADCERATGRAPVAAGAAAVPARVVLPNHAPRIEEIGAFAGGAGVTAAASGATVQVRAAARDVDGDSVAYVWRAAEGAGTLSGSGAQQTWSLGADARHVLYLIARDGKGGYAYRRFDLPVGAARVGFSGRVVDEVTQAAVAGAAVDVGGVRATTNASGWFALSVPPAAAPARYVLNVRHPQYALLSRVHDRAAAGNTYELIRVQTGRYDPTRVIDVVDGASSGPCGPRRRVATLAGLTGLPNAQRPDTLPCRHRGARVVVPAGALVDGRRASAAGPITLALATLNPARRALPGDYRAVDRANAPAELLSFGALYAEFRDASGAPLQLRPGAKAEIRVPVADAQRPAAPPTIAQWSYDERRGLWVEEGRARLQHTPEGWMYVGTTTHFSTLNMDVAGNDPAQATCVRFEVGSSLSGWSNLVLRAYVSYAGTSVQVKETALDGAQYHAVYRIPYAPPAPGPNSLRLELRGTYGGQQVVLLNTVIATDSPRTKMTGTNLWPPYPYTECGVPVTLEADPVALPFYAYNDATGRPFFLTGPYGTFLPENAEQEATDYYQTVDPGNATNPTLQAWWTTHGFAADGSGGTRASYLNHNDLGFGRDMHCLRTGGDLACYVTNYGAPDQNPANADAAANQDTSQRLATVTMEYKASEPADRRVRFYVYGGGNPAAAGKLKFADLDGLGPKPVPHLCTVCHGGAYDNTPAVRNVTEARFREFDLPSFRYSAGRSWDYAPAPTSNTLTPAELTAFAALNQRVREVAPAASPIDSLIHNWYPGGFGAGVAPVRPAVPAGWAGHEAGYHNVYGRSCRTCHVARDNGAAAGYITFPTYDAFKTTSYAVCGSPKLMPNAYVTYKNFWSDPPRVIDYRALVVPANPPCQ